MKPEPSREVYELRSAPLGGFSVNVTPEAMRQLGFETYTDHSGKFTPLSPRETDLVDLEDVMVGKIYIIQFVRVYVIDGEKVINFSSANISPKRPISIIDQEYKDTQPVFKKMAKAFGVELLDYCLDDKDGAVLEYDLNIYIPMTRFDALQSGEQLAQFFKTCSFDTPESIDEAIEAVISN